MYNVELKKMGIIEGHLLCNNDSVDFPVFELNSIVFFLMEGLIKLQCLRTRVIIIWNANEPSEYIKHLWLKPRLVYGSEWTSWFTKIIQFNLAAK